MTPPSPPSVSRRPEEVRDAVAWLRSPAAVRERCALVLRAGQAGELRHFAVHPGRLDAAADLVIETTRAAYPDLDIPLHSRWRHFAAGGVDRWAALRAGLGGLPAEETARLRIDLVVTSVLLDAGAGARWRYLEPGTEVALARSEGLAVASFHAFRSGLFSARPQAPLRADAAALARLDAAALGAAFQVTDDNPLVGLEGRAALLRRLGEALLAQPALFGREAPRVGNLYDALAAEARDGSVSAARVLALVLQGLGDIWPGRLTLGGVNLGDVWRHRAARSGDLTDGLVPFHKLSQWLVYSLVEPLEEAGLRVRELAALTGLPEYRNGGLLLDLGVLELRDPAAAGGAHRVDSELVVEWRALTVALLDALAARVRAGLDMDEARLPLGRVLQGGTWSAGRRAALERRPDGAPPLRVLSDGTVF